MRETDDETVRDANVARERTPACQTMRWCGGRRRSSRARGARRGAARRVQPLRRPASPTPARASDVAREKGEKGLNSRTPASGDEPHAGRSALLYLERVLKRAEGLVAPRVVLVLHRDINVTKHIAVVVSARASRRGAPPDVPRRDVIERSGWRGIGSGVEGVEYVRVVLPESRQIDGRCAVSRLEALRPVRAAPRSDHETARRCKRERAARLGQIDRDNASGDVPPPNDAHNRRDDARLAASHTHTRTTASRRRHHARRRLPGSARSNRIDRGGTGRTIRIGRPSFSHANRRGTGRGSSGTRHGRGAGCSGRARRLTRA